MVKTLAENKTKKYSYYPCMWDQCLRFINIENMSHTKSHLAAYFGWVEIQEKHKRSFQGFMLEKWLWDSGREWNCQTCMSIKYCEGTIPTGVETRCRHVPCGWESWGWERDKGGGGERAREGAFKSGPLSVGDVWLRSNHLTCFRFIWQVQFLYRKLFLLLDFTMHYSVLRPLGREVLDSLILSFPFYALMREFRKEMKGRCLDDFFLGKIPNRPQSSWNPHIVCKQRAAVSPSYTEPALILRG